MKVLWVGFQTFSKKKCILCRMWRRVFDFHFFWFIIFKKWSSVTILLLTDFVSIRCVNSFLFYKVRSPTSIEEWEIGRLIWTWTNLSSWASFWSWAKLRCHIWYQRQTYLNLLFIDVGPPFISVHALVKVWACGEC